MIIIKIITAKYIILKVYNYLLDFSNDLVLIPK